MVCDLQGPVRGGPWRSPMRLNRSAALLAIVASLSGPCALAEPIPARTPIAVFPIAPGKAVARVETTRVDFQPAQAMPMHMHPVPVICFVAKGDFKVKIGDAPERPAPLGSATYEA